MIGFAVSRNGLTSEIKCPCDEEDISRVQDDLDIPYDTDTRVTVVGVDSDIEQLSILEGQEVDLDFLNLLGRLMDGMMADEYEQFRVGLYHEGFTDLRNIINVTQSLGRYSIIDPNDLRQSGLDHELNLRGGIPTDEIEKTDYAAVAQKLIDSGECEKTPYGLLHVNKEVPVSDYFDGRHMPAYYDRDFQIACSLSNGTDTHTLELKHGDTLKILFETEQGSLEMKITAPDGTALYQGDGTVTEFTVTAPLDGAYAIVVVGQKAKGNINIDVERVTRGEGEMEKGGEDEIEASYPGADAVELLNHRGDTTTVYKSAGGTNIPFYL